MDREIPLGSNYSQNNLIMIINSFSLISLLGFQLITWLLFVLSYFLKINLLNFPTWTFWLVIAAWITFVARHNLRQLFILLFAILIFILPSLWFPVTGWDSITLYDFRAQILLHTGNISDTLFRASVCFIALASRRLCRFTHSYTCSLVCSYIHFFVVPIRPNCR